MITFAAILKDGKIYTGKRHCHIIKDNIANKVGKNSIQGFIDENGKFYTREEAAIHALECGQIKELKYNSTQLFSEELWDYP